MKIEYIIIDQNQRFDDMREHLSLLPVERQERIARYRFEKDKLLSLFAGLLIRRAIGEDTILFGEHGKPYTENGICFSVSHSGAVAAIALDDTQIGMDVERIPDEDRLKIADRFFHPSERAYVNDADDPRRAFCEIWTRKEAYLKMTGEGISSDLTAFDTTAFPLCERLCTTAIGEYCLSVCSAEPIREQQIYISELELKDLL